VYEHRTGRVANCGRAKADKDREREKGWRGNQWKEEKTNEIKGMEIEQHALKEENGIERRRIKEEGIACERER